MTSRLILCGPHIAHKLWNNWIQVAETNGTKLEF